jgi:hypothetical protein
MSDTDEAVPGGGSEEFVEVRLKASEFKQISELYEVDVITPDPKRPPFAIPLSFDSGHRVFGYSKRFKALLDAGNVQAVDHGEFKKCVDKLVQIRDESDEGTNRREVVCLQRCRRGGKTFMATAVASQLEKHFEEDDQAPFIIFVSMNHHKTKLSRTETAMSAVLSRVAYELEPPPPDQTFYQFLKKYSNFDAVIGWIQRNSVILLIDELNIISPKREEYEDLSLFLDSLVGREGSALLYTTHHSLQTDLRRGWEEEDDDNQLSSRPHCWHPMPRLNTRSCIRRMNREEHLWSAVLRGRIPALFVLDQEYIANFMPDRKPDTATRRLIFDAVLNGDISELEAGRTQFRSYAYLLKKENENVHVWPPFLCAQKSVLGKDCPNLRKALESPDVNQPKAFEALAELAVVLQLMSSIPRYRNIIPRHSKVTLNKCFDATAIFEIGAEAENIADLRQAVEERLVNKQELYANVLQIVVIPLFPDFPTYDFFLFHRPSGWLGQNRRCSIAAGYQCKMGSKYPDEKQKAARGVKSSIWIEGRGAATGHKGSDKKYGWTLLSRKEHQELLGESLFAALPPADDDEDFCADCNRDNTVDGQSCQQQ